MLLELLLIILFASGLVILGWAYGDTSSADSFNMGGRSANWIHVAFGAFTVVGAGEYVGVTQYAYEIGGYAFALTAGFAAGALFLAIFAARLRAFAEPLRLDSLPDLVAERHGRLASAATSLISCTALTALLVIQLVVGGAALTALAGFHMWISIILITLVVGLYVWFGGLKAIFFTDIVQGSAMLAFLGILSFAIFLGLDTVLLPGDPDASAQKLFPTDLFPPLIENGSFSAGWFALVLFVSGMFAISGGADVWQRLFASRGASTGAKGLASTAVFYLVFGFLLTLVALHISSWLPEAKPADSFIEYVSSLPTWLLAVALVGVFAGSISTADAEVLVLSVVISRELERWGLNPVIEVKDSQRATALLSVVALALALMFSDDVGAIFTVLLFLLMISGPVAWMAVIGRGSNASCFLGQLISLAIFGGLWQSDRLLADGWSLLVPLPVLIACLPLSANPLPQPDLQQDLEHSDDATVS